MGTNTIEQDFGTFVIKRAPDSAYNADIQTKLVCSIGVARRAISAACEQMRWLAVKSQVTLDGIGDVPYRTLRRHFALPELPATGVIPDAIWSAWAKDVNTIAFELDRIDNGLQHRVTIADAQTTRVAAVLRQIEAARPSNPSLPDPASLETWATVSIASRRFSGVVAVKKDRVAAMAPGELQRYAAGDADIRLRPEDKGSVHVNFTSQLANQSVRNVQVACTIIHEASHKFSDTRDFHYTSDAGYGTMRRSEAMRNADSYGFAAIRLYKTHMFADEQAMATPPAGINMSA